MRLSQARREARAAELVEIPFIAVRQWMLGQAPDPVSDLETAPHADGKGQLVNRYA